MPDAGVEGQAGGDMATSRPRLFLWRRTDQPSRRGVKFSVGAVGDDGDVAQQSTASASSAVAPVAARGSEETKGPIADAVTIARVGQPEESGKGAEAGRQQPSGRGGRPDFVQLSYAMKKVPLGSGAVQRGKRRGIRQLQVKKKNMSRDLVRACDAWGSNYCPLDEVSGRFWDQTGHALQSGRDFV